TASGLDPPRHHRHDPAGRHERPRPGRSPESAAARIESALHVRLYGRYDPAMRGVGTGGDVSTEAVYSRRARVHRAARARPAKPDSATSIGQNVVLAPNPPGTQYVGMNSPPWK